MTESNKAIRDWYDNTRAISGVRFDLESDTSRVCRLSLKGLPWVYHPMAGLRQARGAAVQAHARRAA